MRRERGGGTSSDVTSPPDYTETIERVVTALGDRPKGTALIVEGYLNTDLEDSESDRRGSEIAEAMTEAG